MRVLFDANTVIDIAAMSSDYCWSYGAYDVTLLRGFEPVLDASCIADIAYVLHRCGLSRPKVRNEALPCLFEMFTVIDAAGSSVRAAATSPMGDFEDAVIAHSAASVGVDLIVTRNTRDFKHSPVAAMEPAAFVRQFAPSDYAYEVIDLSQE